MYFIIFLDPIWRFFCGVVHTAVQTFSRLVYSGLKITMKVCCQIQKKKDIFSSGNDKKKKKTKAVSCVFFMGCYERTAKNKAWNPPHVLFKFTKATINQTWQPDIWFFLSFCSIRGFYTIRLYTHTRPRTFNWHEKSLTSSFFLFWTSRLHMIRPQTPTALYIHTYIYRKPMTNINTRT